jgi:hypothetical protein
MPRRNFNDGMEITHEDLNDISAAIERGLFDRFLHELLLRSTDAFFSDGFLPERVNANTVSLRAGLGIQEDSAAVSPEPEQKPLYLSAQAQLIIETPHASLDRIDIVCVKAELADELSATRKFKDAATSVITSPTQVVQKDWAADCILVTGTPDGSPVAPATPAGYLRIGQVLVTAASGIAVGDVTDERTVLNLSGAGGYDAVVGSGPDATHTSLALALAAVGAGSRILQAQNETVDTMIVVSLNNIQIDFKPGVTLSKGTATKGLQLTGDGIRINGGRFSGFSTAGDKAIEIAAGADYAMIRDTRFANCDTEIDDLNGAASLSGTLTE